MLRFASRGATVLAGLLVGLALTWGLASNPGTASASGETVTTELVPGWNLAGWMGEEAGVDDLFEEIPALEVVHAWDAGEQTFLWAVRDIEAPYRTLETVTPGMGLWLYLGGTEPFPWTRPLLLASGVASLGAGWNLVGWAARDGISAEEALSHVEGFLVASWLWDGAEQEFAAVAGNSAQMLERGDALWVEASGETQWLQLDGRMQVVFEREVSTAFRAETQATLDDVVAFFARQYNLTVAGITVLLDTRTGCGGGYANETIFMREGCLDPTPHEYSHAVQEYLATLEPDGSWGTVRYKIGPSWLSEAVANIASAFYRDSRGIEPLDEHREHSRLTAITNQTDLEALEYDMSIGGDVHANYRLASAAGYWLIDNVGEQPLYEFYRVRPSSTSWQGAFFKAFGMPVSTFYRDFKAYRDELSAGLPRFAGRVVGPDGEGVEDIRIEVIPAGAGEQLNVKTDEAGRFSGRTLQGTYEVSIFWSDSPCHIGWYGGLDGHTTDPAQINRLQFPESDGTGIVIRLPRPGPDLCRTISGVVVDTSGEPVAGLWVSASAQHKQVGYSGQDTTQEGAFSLLVRAGGTYEIHMSTGIVESCTVASDDAKGPRAQISLSEGDVTGVRVTVVRQLRAEPMWVACTAAR